MRTVNCHHFPSSSAVTVTWSQLLAQHRVQKHATSKQELDDLRAVVARDLADADLQGLSDDRRFATAYNAVLQLSRMAIACAGYRTTGTAHHYTTFEALPLAMGADVSTLATYSFCIIGGQLIPQLVDSKEAVPLRHPRA